MCAGVSLYKSRRYVACIKLVIQPPGTCRYTHINHLLNTYHSGFFFAHWTYAVSFFFLCELRKYVNISALCTGCSSCLWVNLLRVERLQHLTERCIHKSQLYMHNSVYANRHGAALLYKVTGKPFMKLSCSRLVWIAQSSGQIAPICVRLCMCNCLCDGKKSYLSHSVYNTGCMIDSVFVWVCMFVCEEICVYCMRSVVCVCVVCIGWSPQSLLVQTSSSVIVGYMAVASPHKATCNNRGVLLCMKGAGWWSEVLCLGRFAQTSLAPDFPVSLLHGVHGGRGTGRKRNRERVVRQLHK